MSRRPGAQAGLIGSDKTEKISVQCTPEQKFKLLLIAKANGLTTSSAMVRKWIDETEVTK